MGSSVVQRHRGAFAFAAPSRREADLTDEASVRRAVRETRPDQILYAAGFSRMNDAERERDSAFALNATAPGWIAEEAAVLGAPFHYLSTNAVFSGTSSGRPYREDDAPEPTSVYGQSKLAGEQAVRAASPRNSVLRLISVYSAAYPPREDFARRIASALRNGTPVEGISDDFFNPLFADRCADAIAAALQRRASGVYHLGATDVISNADFVRLVASELRADQGLVRPVAFAAFMAARPGMAPRGPNAALDVSAFRRTFGDDLLATNRQSVHEFVTQLSAV